MTASPILVKLPAAARQIGVSYSTLYAMIKTDKIPPSLYITSGRKKPRYYIKIAQLCAWLESGAGVR